MRTATATETRGATMPSFSPLSTLRARRTRLGTAVFVTIPAPKPASVGARHAATRSADHPPNTLKKAAAKRAPRTIVKGSPIPSKRAERPMSWRNDISRSRAASVKRMRTRVISAVTLMLEADREIRSAFSPPRARPPIANTIGAVSPTCSARPETAVQSTMRAATTARSPQLIRAPPLPNGLHRRSPAVVPH